MQVEFVPRAEDLDEAVWRECFPPPQEGRFWYRTLETCGLEDQFSFCYARISADGRTVGIAPCFCHDVPIALVAPAPVAWALRHLAKVFPRVGYQRTFFVGSPCADEGTIGLVPGIEVRNILGELRHAISAKARALGAHMIVFKDVPETAVAALAAPDHGREWVSTVSYPGTILPLPTGSKDAYLRALSHNRRHNLLKKLRRSQALLKLETRVVAQPSDRELDEIFGLFLQTYTRGKTKFERLDRRFFERIRGQEPAHFILLRSPADGRLAAFMLVFVLGDRVINKFIGLDYRRDPKAFLYFRLFDAALDFAYARGARELQSGQTGYRAKFDLGHRLVPLCNVFHHDRTAVHALFRTIGRRISWKSLDDELAGHERAPSA